VFGVAGATRFAELRGRCSELDPEGRRICGELSSRVASGETARSSSPGLSYDFVPNSHECRVSPAGTVQCRGFNPFAQLGDALGTLAMADDSDRVRVPALEVFTQVAGIQDVQSR
jgi:hypothetical protein